MHFEILVEGQTELTTLSILMSKIIGEYSQPHTWKIHKHRGISQLPDNLLAQPNPKDRTLLHNLPSKLRAYGKENRQDQLVVVLVDLDDRPNCLDFKNNLLTLLAHCKPKPRSLFRIAIEELEAWFLDDRQALTLVYPTARKEKLDNYVQDAQCGTWEFLADIIHLGGKKALQQYGKRSPRLLQEKIKWAKSISPYMNVEKNASPSFKAFRDGLRQYIPYRSGE